MINLLDKVQIKWSTRNKKYYIDKGYEFTSFGDVFSVYIKDIPKDSSIMVPVKCDGENCTSHDLWTPYRNYNKIIKEHGKYLCKSCTIKENHNNFLNHDRTERWSKMYQVFLDKCEQNNCIPITTFDEFEGQKTYMKYICPIHGETQTLMNRIMYNDAWCYKCGKMHMADKNRLSSSVVKEVVESKNNNILLNPDEYVSNSTKNLKVICGSCGNVFITSLAAIRAGDGRCADCGCRVGGDILRTTKEELIELSTIDGELMVMNPDDYIDMYTPLLFKCSECGDTFLATPHNYLKRGFTRCENCRQYSKGEDTIANILDGYNVLYERQKKYDDCKDKRKLPYDFYLPEYNSLIEFQGKQHYAPVKFWGGQKRLEYVQRHDKIKYEYAISHEIDLLIISYLEQDNIEQILKEKYNLE